MKVRAGRALIALLFVVTVAAISAAFAASMSISSDDLSVFAPNQQPPSCTSETNTFFADRDSYVNVGSGTNFGGANTLRVESGGGLGGTRSRALVRFGLPAVPQGCTITSGTWRLYNQTPTSGRTIQALRITTDWQENTVNGNAIPTTTGSAATSDTTGTAGYQQWTVTAQLLAMYTNGNFGFLIRDASESTSVIGSSRTQVYQSREGDPNDPQLVISWAQV